MNPKVSGFFRRLVLLCLLLGLIPVGFIGGFSYYRSSRMIQDNVNKANMDNLLQTQLRVEQELINIQQSFLSFANLPIVKDSLKQPLTAIDFQKVNEISADMRIFQNYQTKIKNIYLISINKDWVLSYAGLSSFREQTNRDSIMKFTGNTNISFWDCRKDSGSGRYIAPLSTVKMDGINFISKLPTDFTTPTGILVVNMTNYEITKLLLKDQQIGSVMVVDRNWQVLACNDDALIGKDLSKAKYISEIIKRNSNSGHFTTKVNGIMSGVDFITSEYNGWTYLSLVSLKDVTAESRNIGLVTLFVCILIAGLVALFSFLGSNKIYDPVRRLYRAVLLGMDNRAGETVRDELKFIGDRISYLLSNNNRMSAQMEQLIEQLKELFTLKVIHGEIRPDETEGKLKMLGYASGWSWLKVVSIQIGTYENSGFDMQDEELMMFALRNIVEELIPENTRFKPAMSNSYLVVVVFGSGDAADEPRNLILKYAGSIQKTVGEQMGFKISMGISRTYNRITDLKAAYEESTEALKRRVLTGEEALLFLEDIEPRFNTSNSFPEKIADELVNAVKIADRSRAESLLDEILEELQRSEHNLQDYQIFLVRLLADLLLIVQKSGHSIQTVNNGKGSLAEKLYQLKSKEEIRNWFKQSVIRPIADLLEDERNSHFRDIADRVIKMIHEEFDTGLTLETCAARLNYNYGYIRRILLQVYGINFSEYLAKVQTDIAKKWLSETSMTISEIAERMKYNNTQNFIRFFKKQEGITPGKYREDAQNSIIQAE